jgi:hypothetical protein
MLNVPSPCLHVETLGEVLDEGGLPVEHDDSEKLLLRRAYLRAQGCHPRDVILAVRSAPLALLVEGVDGNTAAQDF